MFRQNIFFFEEIEVKKHKKIHNLTKLFRTQTLIEDCVYQNVYHKHAYFRIKNELLTTSTNEIALINVIKFFDQRSTYQSPFFLYSVKLHIFKRFFVSRDSFLFFVHYFFFNHEWYRIFIVQCIQNSKNNQMKIIIVFYIFL